MTTRRSASIWTTNRNPICYSDYHHTRTASSASYDLHQKKRAYRRNGVREYLVHRVDDGQLDWFCLENDEYVAQSRDADGCLQSRVFPGLRLDPAALFAGDHARLRHVVEQACASPGHAALCARLATV